jgi:hypothetical protein
MLLKRIWELPLTSTGRPAVSELIFQTEGEQPETLKAIQIQSNAPHRFAHALVGRRHQLYSNLPLGGHLDLQPSRHAAHPGQHSRCEARLAGRSRIDWHDNTGCYDFSFMVWLSYFSLGHGQ